ncbi:MAG TPA: hypothetical protein VFT10_04240, partial [Solirubrobacterales bacterium]|nr:hypothetical protein [Solirubrobacterales bacterium]
RTASRAGVSGLEHEATMGTGSPRGRDGPTGAPSAPQRANRSASLAPARIPPAQNRVAYVWSAIALTPAEALLSALGMMDLRLPIALAESALSQFLSAPAMDGIAGAGAVTDMPVPNSEPKPRFEDSAVPSLPSTSQILSAVLLLASLALLASLPFMLRRQLAPPRRRPL